MRNLQRFFAAVLVSALMAAPAFSLTRAVPVNVGNASQSTGALERGYRTGYSDGYQAGFRDSSDHAARDYRSKEEYKTADRAYAASYGSLEDYRDGYQQGFEVGYDSGYEHHGFDSTVPTGITRRGVVAVDNATTANIDDDTQNSSSSSSSSSRRTGSSGGGVVTTTGSARNTGGSLTIPSNTVMRIELLTNLSTEASQKGDRFQARVLEPAEYEGAMLEGRVSRVKRAGRVGGSSELQLSFEQISMNGRWSDFQAQVTEVISQGGTGVGDVDEEGGVRGTGSTRSDVTKIGAASAIGAIIGAIAGGGKGAAIGAAIGAGVGTAGAISSRGTDIRLPAGQQLKIRTSNYTQIK